MASRAVLKKRKRKEKLLDKVGLSKLDLPGVSGIVEETDDFSSDDENFDFDTSVATIKSKTNRKGHINQATGDVKDAGYDDELLFGRKSYQSEYEATYSSYFISQLLQLPLQHDVSSEDDDNEERLDGGKSYFDCYMKAAMIFSCIISSTLRDTFYTTYWNKMHILCNSLTPRFSKLLTWKQMKNIFSENIFHLDQDVLYDLPSIPSPSSSSSSSNDELLTIEGQVIQKYLIKALTHHIGGSVTLLQPQKHFHAFWQLLSNLEFEFQSRICASITIQTPQYNILNQNNSNNKQQQRDDEDEEGQKAVDDNDDQSCSSYLDNEFDQFILQICGESYWKIKYHHQQQQRQQEEEKKDSKYKASAAVEIIEVTANNTLYLPKGCQYQKITNQQNNRNHDTSSTSVAATNSKDEQNAAIKLADFNVFVTIFTSQSHATNADLLQLAIPQAIDILRAADLRNTCSSNGGRIRVQPHFNRSLPERISSIIGVAATTNPDEEGEELELSARIHEAEMNVNENGEDDHNHNKNGLKLLKEKLSNLKRRKMFLSYVEKVLMPMVSKQVLEILDPAADQLRKKFLMERLPIPLTAEEEACTAAGASHATIYPYTQLRAVRPDIAIALIEDGKVIVYHCMDNARELFGHDMSPLEFELDDGPAIEMLLTAYPHAVTVSDLEHSSEELEDKIGIAQALFKEGLLMIVDDTSKPVQAVQEEMVSDKKKPKKQGGKKEQQNTKLSMDDLL